MKAPRPRKRFGQNFLEPAWIDKVIRAIDPQPDQTFIEIGPGRGALTRPLAARAKAVIAYEIDRDLASDLERTAPPNVHVIEGDFLDLPIGFGRLANNAREDVNMPSTLRAAGNLPYNVAAPILFKLVDLYLLAEPAGRPLVDATVMLQREVADRLLAEPGTKDYGVLTVLIGHAARVERLLALPPGAFRPAPKVYSSLVRLTFHRPDSPVRDRAVFTAIVQAVFTRRRKTLANALLALGSERGRSRVGAGSEQSRSRVGAESEQSRSRVGAGSESVYSVYRRLAPREALTRARLDGTRRPETLSIAEFAQLADVYASISR